MREFKDSITGKDSGRDLDEDDDAETRRKPEAALDRPDEESAPVDGEVVSDRAPR